MIKLSMHWKDVQMKILKLEVKNVRGIPHGEFVFEGANVVLLGGNGTGKSSILTRSIFAYR